MFVRFAGRPRHLHPVRPDARQNLLTSFLRFVILVVTRARLGSGTAPIRQFSSDEPERQLVSHQVDDVASSDVAGRFRPHTVDLYVAPGNCFSGETACFVKTREPKPFVDSQRLMILFVFVHLV